MNDSPQAGSSSTAETAADPSKLIAPFDRAVEETGPITEAFGQMDHDLLIPLLLIKCLEADFDSLLRQLRPGRTPTVHMPTTSDQLLRRVSNLMLRVSFDDEQQWAIRIRQQRDGPLSCYTPAFRAMTLRSEYATLKAMEGKGLPVPAVYGEDIYEQDGLEFMFFQWIEGNPCRLEWDWPRTDEGPRDWCQIDSPDDVKKWIDQLADFNIRLTAVTFDRIGSLTLDRGDVSAPHDPVLVVGPLIDKKTFIYRAMWDPAIIPTFGPFRTSRERYMAIIDWVLRGIDLDGYKSPIRTCTLHLWLRHCIETNSELNAEESEFFIVHGEPKGDHVMLDSFNKFTGIIDWEFSYVGTKVEALAPPTALRSDQFRLQGDNSWSLLEEYYFSALKDLGRPDLAQLARQSRIHQRLACVLGSDGSKLPMSEIFALEILLTGMHSPAMTREAWFHEKMVKLTGHAKFKQVVSASRARRAAKRKGKGKA